MLVTIESLIQALQGSWSAKTCFEASEWSLDNPARGQCVASSLVIQEFLGGGLMRYRVTGRDFKETHYCNVLPDGTILDTTGSQYKEPVSLVVEPISLNGFRSIREKRLADKETRTKYEILLEAVQKSLSLPPQRT